MLKQVLPHKIHFGHRVLNISEENNKIGIHLSNNDTINSDILVGAMALTVPFVIACTSD
jgi:2-polyprenyl-6-methoxyphenol hydroxylase-like FAD-dependent oxidoreductase